MTASLRQTSRELISTFLVIQGFGCLLWWGMLWKIPATRQFFTFRGLPESMLLSFALPDVVLYGATALVAAHALAERWKCAVPLVCLHAGAAIYAELHVLSLAQMTSSGWNGVVLMAPSSILLVIIVAHLMKTGGR